MKMIIILIQENPTDVEYLLDIYIYIYINDDDNKS